MTHCETAENAAASCSQPLEIASETKKALSVDRFCLTGLGRRSYFAGPPPSGCGGNEAASATYCGTIVDCGGLPGDGWWIYLDGELRLVGGILWHLILGE